MGEQELISVRQGVDGEDVCGRGCARLSRKRENLFRSLERISRVDRETHDVNGREHVNALTGG